ncbi:lactose regulatory protein LAC9 [Xylariomycetidae sp. FL2044]|nr:lactose regulatory protein LAC9 [Xylariomycetidae sp. FL2044]
MDARTSPLACDPCRNKKLKCTREIPACSTCQHNRRICRYSGRVVRSPLTRAYLSSVEKRMKNLENLIAKKLPDLDIEEALAANDFTGPDSHGGTVALDSPSSRPTRASIELDTGTPNSGNAISEAVPEEADGFDWHEDADELADGMAALSVKPRGTGYLGPTAGVFFLRSLLFWMGNPDAVLNAGLERRTPPRDFDQASSSSRLSHSLASRQVMSRLMDSYFSVYHVTYPFIHEATFRAQFYDIIPRPQDRSWQMLLYTILALGAWCLDAESTELDDDLYHHAMSFGEDQTLFESANLTFIQALTLLSNLAQKRDRPNTGSNFLGVAIRNGLSLGLHRELPDWNISLLQREMRRRAWWGLYLFDSGASTTFGRPILLPGRESMDVRQVMNIEDECLTPRTTKIPPETAMPTIYSGMKTQSDLHVHSNHISNRLLSPTGVSVDEALSMNQQLDDWTKSIPPYFDLKEPPATSDHWYLFARERLWWRFWNFKIILFRQFLLARAIDQQRGAVSAVSDTLENKCRITGVEAAHATIISIHRYLEAGLQNRLVSWYSLFFLFHASLAIALSIRGDGQSTDLPVWQEDIELVRNTLRNVLSGNPLAARCADILSHILPTHAQDLTAFETIQGEASGMEFPYWPMDQTDIFSSFPWPDVGQGI